MIELSAVLAAFHEATGCEAAVWTQSDDRGRPVVEASAPAGKPPQWFVPPPATAAGPTRVATDSGVMWVCAVPGQMRAWLSVGPCASDDADPERLLPLLTLVVGQQMQAELEVEHAANELAERYEEINLLYTTSEILGRTVSLEETATTILREISETVGARRASILVHDRVTDTLQVAAALGADPADAPPIAVQDPCSLSAHVFRTRSATIAEADEMPCPAESLYRKGVTLSVPIMWTSPSGGSEPLGVVNLSDRATGQGFTAGDQKLMAAIATQIGTAIQNARLVRSSLSQQRLAHEMHLAHDLQMRLLPDPGMVAPARVAARVVPAESVGGDFYNLFRLRDGRTGVMIGDVSGHGYRAALIMALTMSASAIHAQRLSEPAQTLAALLQSVSEELATTEMFISIFYGVIDDARREIRYANAGHPHAFIVRADGEVERLAALDAPLGMVPEPPSEAARPWSADDTLLLFTDGISDARDRLDRRLGEEAVLEAAVRHRHEAPDDVQERIFERLRQHAGDSPRRDDLTLVVVRS